MSSIGKPRKKIVARDGDDSKSSRNERNKQDHPDPQDKLSKAFREILGRDPEDSDRQQLFGIMQSMGVQDNDAIYSIAILLYSYGDKFSKIPGDIETAAKTHQEALTAAADLAAIQAQTRINDAVLTLLPNIRADIRADVGRSAGAAFKRIELGRGMFSLWGGAMIAAALIILGILIDSGVYRLLLTNPKQVQAFQTIYGWQIAIALSLPPFRGLGIYALQDDYNNELKLAGWLIIVASVVGFLVPGLKIMGWWF